VSGPEILPGEIQPPVTQPSSGNGNAVEKQQETYMDVVEKEPEFPGGILAWQRFLSRNLMTPEGMESGERKTVQIRFQVAADGAVTSFEVLQSGGKILDNEVIRVLKMMPRWKPAIQNGHPVARSFTQPVTFIGAEE
jgi:protein TonB